MINKYNDNFYQYDGFILDKNNNKYIWSHNLQCEEFVIKCIDNENIQITLDTQISALNDYYNQYNKRIDIIKNKINEKIKNMVIEYYNELNILYSPIFEKLEDKTNKILLKETLLNHLQTYSRNNLNESNHDIIIDVKMENIFIKTCMTEIKELYGIDEMDLIMNFLIPIQEKIKSLLIDYINNWY